MHTHLKRTHFRANGRFTMTTQRPYRYGTSRYESARQTSYQPLPRTARDSGGRRPNRRRRRSRGSLGVTVVAFLVIAAIVGGGVWMWLNRTVKVNVGGSWIDVRAESTLEDIAGDQGLTFKAGNLVSVGGNVLEEGGGTPFSATVNGQDLDAEQADAFRAKGNEQIVFGDGGDVTEPSHEEERTSQPKLVPYERIGAVTFVSQYGKDGRQMYTIGEVSGEEVPGEVIEPAQDVVLQSVNPDPGNGRKVIALTFDDGPSDYTQRYLDILSEYGARATFFCLGTQIPGRENLVKAIVDQGSQVASHTQSHQQLTAVDAETLKSEVTSSFDAISAAGGGNTTVIRPPYGSFDANAWLASGGTLSSSVIWNLDSLDWELPGVETIVNNCTQGAWSGSIILMHDGGGNRDQDLEALPKILQKLKDKGYEFVTLSELMAMDSRIPAEVAAGTATMPEDAVWATAIAE